MTSVNPKTFQALVIAKALELYAQTGIKVNRAYTPKNMLAMANKLTGKPFKPRQYLEAATALREYAVDLECCE